MREIIFRGKRVDNGKWVYGYLKFVYIDVPEKASIYSPIRVRSFDVITKTVGQYTGLKDVHGTRIFEGDVVKSIAAWYVVEFENGGYGLRPFGKGKLIPIMGHGNFNENEVEVIGNVYDNQEILKGEREKI